MKKLLLPLIFLLLAFIAFWLWRSNTGSTLSGPLSDFAVPDTAKVDRIFIADKQGLTADLRRTVLPNGVETWTVNGLPANQFPVRTLLKTFLKVEVRTPVAKSMQAMTLKLMASNAIKVEIYTGEEKPEKIWWLGHGTPDHFGVYAVLEKPGVGRSDSPFVLGMSGFTGLINTRFHARLDEWRSTDLAIYPDLDQITRVKVEHPMLDSAGYTITYGGGREMGLLDEQDRPLAFDSVIVMDVLMHLTDAHFEYFERTLPKAQVDSIKATVPWHVITITANDGRSQRIPFWKKEPYQGERNVDFDLLVEDVDRMHALLQDTALVVVQRYWFDRMVPYLGQVKAR